MSGSGRAGCNQRLRARPRSRCAQRGRCQETGSGGGWVAPFRKSQLAVDTTLVSVLQGDGSARTGEARRDCVALAAARRAKERRYPELVRRRARARLVVLVAEVKGRWSPETQKLSLLARARARAEDVGGLCWRAQWHGQWPHRFWNFHRLLGRTVRHLRSVRLKGIWQVSSGEGPLA